MGKNVIMLLNFGPPYKTNYANIGKLISLFILLTFLLIRIAIIFSYVPEIAGIDNNFVYSVTRMLGGYLLYPNPEAFPYSANIYAPIYFNICNFFGSLININPEDTIQVYRLCRTISLICDVISVFILHEILLKLIKVTRVQALLFIAVFSCILCYLAYTFSRVDSLFLTLYALVFYLLIKDENRQPKRCRILLIAFLCAACVFTKQNGIVLPVTIAVSYLLSSNSKATTEFLLGFILFCAIFYIIFVEGLDYQFLLDSTVKGVKNRIDLQWFYVNILKAMANSLLIIPIGAGLTLSLFSFNSQRRKSDLIYPNLFLLQLIFSTGTALKWGSTLGYYNECFFLSFILLARHLTINPNKTYSRELASGALLLLVVFFMHVSLQDYLFFVKGQKARKIIYDEQLAVKKYLRSNLSHYHVFNMGNPNRDFFKTLLFKEMASPNFDTIDCCLLPDKTFDYTALKNEFSTGKIKYIIFPKGKFEPSIWGQSLQHYQKDTTLFDYDIYMYHLPKQ